jgi:hypothetical protein
MDEKNLLPCPFCGADAFTWTAIQGTKVSCSKDCVTMPPRFDMWFTSIEEAIKHWNRRTLREKIKSDPSIGKLVVEGA